MNFPDVEEMLLNFFPSYTDATIVTTVPKPRPSRFVRLWRNGGAAANRILDRPMVTIEGWSTDSVDAHEITAACRMALLEHSSLLPLVRGVDEITGPYWIPDPESETPRYRFTMQLTVRAAR